MNKKKETYAPIIALNKAWARMDSIDASDKRAYEEAKKAAEKLREAAKKSKPFYDPMLIKKRP